jgi:hypothetical protein
VCCLSWSDKHHLLAVATEAGSVYIYRRLRLAACPEVDAAQLWESQHCFQVLVCMFGTYCRTMTAPVTIHLNSCHVQLMMELCSNLSTLSSAHVIEQYLL